MQTLATHELHQWQSILRGVTRLLVQLDRDLDSHSGLSLSEYSVLEALSENGEQGVRMTQLAEVSMLSKSRLSHCVDRLVKGGLVKRERVPGDRRGFVALLTTTGFARLERAKPEHAADVRNYLFNIVGADELAIFARVAELIQLAPERGTHTLEATIDLTS